MKTTLLANADIARIVRHVGLDRLMDMCIEAIEDACRGFDGGAFQIPKRAGFAYTDPQPGLLEWMPAMRIGEKVLVKMVGYHPRNPQRAGVPTILSTVLTFDTVSGNLSGVTDGAFMTSLRTGAASAVASRVLAVPESRVLGLIGCGAQAVTQLHALSRTFNFDTVLLNDVDDEACRSFPARAAMLGLSGVAYHTRSMRDIIDTADVVCTATSIDVDAGPLFHEFTPKPTLHVNAVGSDFPGKVELPLALLQRSVVCADFPAQALLEGEAQQLDESDLGPDLVALVKDAAQHAAHRATTTVFDSTGWALEDYVTTEILNDLGRELGCGTIVDLAGMLGDPKHPYAFLDDSAAAEPGVTRLFGEN